ncbi:hypothetical protein BGZ61DRAFT_467562 [Ilyonectria robusta]|uniref:uncharacterized protein n=1 Tax=Ilyonectria robusta TaxID=1079257 RepID=UPI001E8DE3F4|nr:uncharacterized protein BGZ61DRAFT_467562 [Ilyonectria robusta]KAH8654660.1 hypothetical protein BGZ61DRAFT_467562 [Ilyonectria robusta]
MSTQRVLPPRRRQRTQLACNPCRARKTGSGWRSIPRPPSTHPRRGNGWSVHPFPSIPWSWPLHNPSIHARVPWNGCVEMEAGVWTGKGVLA